MLGNPVSDAFTFINGSRDSAHAQWARNILARNIFKGIETQTL